MQTFTLPEGLFADHVIVADPLRPGVYFSVFDDGSYTQWLPIHPAGGYRLQAVAV